MFALQIFWYFQVIKKIGGWSALANDTKLGRWDDAMESKWDITDALLQVQLYASPFLTLWVSPDDKDSNANIIQVRNLFLIILFF